MTNRAYYSRYTIVAVMAVAFREASSGTAWLALAAIGLALTVAWAILSAYGLGHSAPKEGAQP